MAVRSWLYDIENSRSEKLISELDQFYLLYFLFVPHYVFQIIILISIWIWIITYWSGKMNLLVMICLLLFSCSAWTAMAMTSANVSSTWICCLSAGRTLVLCWMPRHFPCFAFNWKLCTYCRNVMFVMMVIWYSILG